MKRLEMIASLVTKDASVIDIGTDHAYLPIYLYKNNITKNVVASDISAKVLEYTKKNIKEAGLIDKIKVVQSDGFKNITDTFDEGVIAGMGTHTIIDILKHGNIPNSLIISSHNNLYELRSFMQDFGYKIINEVVAYENDEYYDIIKYQKGRDNLSKEELMIGISKDKKYLAFLKDKYQKLYDLSKKEIYFEYINAIGKIQAKKN